MDRRRFIKGSTHTLAGSLADSLATSLGLPAAALLAARDAGAAQQASETGAAPTRREIVRVLAQGAPNSLDPHGDSFNRESIGAFTNVYDRLLQFDRTPIPGHAYHYDYQHMKGELATAFDSLDNGRAWRFHLRRDARFHSGALVTANAVKWSLDRAVTLPASKRQLASGSLTDPAQFVVEDPFTLRIDLPRPDRYALPNLALSYTSILDADTIRAHAGADDPWGAAWLRGNAAGGGAYRVADWQSGQRVDYVRNDAWRSGPLPYMRRALVQAVPEAANRSAALARGDADIALQLAPRDFDAVGKLPGVTTLSIPLTNTFRFIAFNTQRKPFNDVRVRQAIAFALPYEDLFSGVAQGHGTRLFGAAPGSAPTPRWPQPYPYSTRLDQARALLKEAGLPNGFKTTLTYNTTDSDIAEPAALLVQQSLKAVGIDITIEKAPGAQWGALQTEKRLPFFIDWSSAWLNDPDYFYRIFFEGDWRWNVASFNDPALVKLTDAARWETDPARYDALMRQAAALVIRAAPLLPLWLPSFDIAMRNDLRGFTYYIHGQVDFRPLQRA
ncbi:MAG: ABC transporter substrate-binding protein [Janthinobacterium lividum]